MRLGQVLAVRPLALEQVGTASRRNPSRPRSSQKRSTSSIAVLHRGLVVVEVGLVAEEAVPVVRRRPASSQVQFEVSVSMKMIRASRVAVGCVRPDVPVALRRVGARARLLEPAVVDRGVVHHEVGDHADAALVGRVDERRGRRRSCRSRGARRRSRRCRSRRRAAARGTSAAARCSRCPSHSR